MSDAITTIGVATIVYIDHAALSDFWGDTDYDERTKDLPCEVAVIGGRWFWQYTRNNALRVLRHRLLFVREAMLVSPFGHWSWYPLSVLRLADDQYEGVQAWRRATLQSGAYWNN